MRAYHRTESDGVSVAVGIHLTAYALVFGLFALWLHSLLQPRVLPNPGLAAYAPPPGVVISYDMPGRLLAQHGQAPPLAELTARREEPETTGRSAKPAVEPEPERTIHVQAPARTREPAAPLPEPASPASHRAAAYPGYSGDRPF
jgi:hypothetical protein